MEAIYILIIALVLDLAAGEPPNCVHPVAGMGKVISFLMQGSRRYSERVQFFYGMTVSLVTIAVFGIPVYFLLHYLRDFNTIAYILAAAVIFKTCFALQGLRRSAVKIRNLLVKGNLLEARFQLRSLVGRDTGKLDTSQMVSATVESVAENSCDSFFAPLFYFALFGVTGAVVYRVINTLDSMIGHHGEYEYLGKFAARLDSAVNYIPARITAVLIIAAAWLCRRDAAQAWRIMLRDRRNTESTNAGWTMSAVAGALGVQLEKVGFYKLGDSRNPLVPGLIDTSLRIALVAAGVWSLLIILAEVIYYAAT